MNRSAPIEKSLLSLSIRIEHVQGEGQALCKAIGTGLKGPASNEGNGSMWGLIQRSAIHGMTIKETSTTQREKLRSPPRSNLGVAQNFQEPLLRRFRRCFHVPGCHLAVGQKPGYPPMNIPIPTKMKTKKWVVNSPATQNGIPLLLTTTAIWGSPFLERCWGAGGPSKGYAAQAR